MNQGLLGHARVQPVEPASAVTAGNPPAKQLLAIRNKIVRVTGG
jgi:hypothetical protein